MCIRDRHKIKRTSKKISHALHIQEEAQAIIDKLINSKAKLEADIEDLSGFSGDCKEVNHTPKLLLEEKLVIGSVKARTKVRFNKITCLVLGIALCFAALW
eukprot:TRINITY_DN6452_c0_g4_i3.p1 TRINITY_DN6452_c0_g4~~TRINITY_DN6452_c0_g4_i3.p1  ORF type:complete len:101 (-),score=22.78 TRINITY_DN6452_c0_g4_i3:118-420(-)